MAKSWFNPNLVKKRPHGKVVGEIVFSRRSASLPAEGKKPLDQLVEILLTHPNGITPSKLTLLGDTAAHDSPKRDPKLAKQRAESVKTYIEGKLTTAERKLINISTAGKGVAMPGQTASQADRRAVVEIINKGLPLKKARPLQKKAMSLKEALKTAIRGLSAIDQKKHPKAFQRIGYWLIGPAKHSITREDKRDGYFEANSDLVKRYANLGKKELSAAEFKRLLDEHRIGKELMKFGSKDSPAELVALDLLSIDRRILDGLDFLMKKAGTSGAGGKSNGLWQMIKYMLSRPDDWLPPAGSDVENRDPFSFYWIYFQKLPK